MGCGCKKDMSEPQGNYNMKFVGKPNGKLLKGAPGNYTHGVIYKQPFRMSKFPYWQLMEPVPELRVPEVGKGDSVYEDAIYVPDDEAEPLGEFTPIVPTEDINADPNTGATIEPYMTYSQKDGKMKAYVDKREPQPVPEPTPEPEPEEEEPGLDRDALKAILDEKGVKYLKNARTVTLAKMVEALET